MKKVLLTSVSMACLACAATASAQDASENEANASQTGIADIVVTATRQATNMQDTPIAITAIIAVCLKMFRRLLGLRKPLSCNATAKTMKMTTKPI